MTARMIFRAVAFCEINSNRLKARNAGWQSSMVKTPLHDCRVILKAVVSCEINSNRLKARKQAGSHL